jgi:hypothetical protein
MVSSLQNSISVNTIFFIQVIAENSPYPTMNRQMNRREGCLSAI